MLANSLGASRYLIRPLSVIFSSKKTLVFCNKGLPLLSYESSPLYKRCHKLPQNASEGTKKPQWYCSMLWKQKILVLSRRNSETNLEAFSLCSHFLCPCWWTRHVRHLYISSCRQSSFSGSLSTSRVTCCFKVKGSGKADRSLEVSCYMESICSPISCSSSLAIWWVFHRGTLQNHSILTSCVKGGACSHPT